MAFIYTVEKLIEILNNTSPNEYAKVFERIRIEESNLNSYSTWDKHDYTRNCLVRTHSYEVILLCWDAAAKTPIHGHGGKDCWVYQVQGTIEEIRFEEVEGNLKEINRMLIAPGKLTYMHDRMGYHSLENKADNRAMTLHIYASPIDSCKVYNDNKDCFEIKEMSYDTFRAKKAEPTV